jgi:hypothetical protein
MTPAATFIDYRRFTVFAFDISFTPDIADSYFRLRFTPPFSLRYRRSFLSLSWILIDAATPLSPLSLHSLIISPRFNAPARSVAFGCRSDSKQTAQIRCARFIARRLYARAQRAPAHSQRYR